MPEAEAVKQKPEQDGHAEAESQAEEIDKTVVRRGILTPYWPVIGVQN